MNKLITYRGMLIADKHSGQRKMGALPKKRNTKRQNILLIIIFIEYIVYWIQFPRVQGTVNFLCSSLQPRLKARSVLTMLTLSVGATFECIITTCDSQGIRGWRTAFFFLPSLRLSKETSQRKPYTECTDRVAGHVNHLSNSLFI